MAEGDVYKRQTPAIDQIKSQNVRLFLCRKEKFSQIVLVCIKSDCALGESVIKGSIKGFYTHCVNLPDMVQFSHKANESSPFNRLEIYDHLKQRYHLCIMDIKLAVRGERKYEDRKKDMVYQHDSSSSADRQWVQQSDLLIL